MRRRLSDNYRRRLCRGALFFSIRLIDVIFAARARTLKQVGAVEFLGFRLHPSMLAAGPITTLAEFRQARIANWSVVDYGSGIARRLVGLVKKLAADLWLAPLILRLAQTVAIHPEFARARIVWPMLFRQLLYVYLDFTGYTDLALGTGRALGWWLPENFNLPLVRSNLQRFWRSWHMTLSNWGNAACLFSGVYRIPFAYSGRRLRDAGHWLLAPA
jgi:alginate O-acetyltransferase complex protein AlgI